MAIATASFSSPEIAKLTAASIQRELENAIVAELEAIVIPKIKQMAKEAAEKFCAESVVEYHKKYCDPHGTVVCNVLFKG